MTFKRELRERSNPSIIKGGDRYKRKQVTKRQLVENFKGGGLNMSPVINTEVREGADDVKVGEIYQITNVEEIVTDVQAFVGIRVMLMTAKANEGNIVLWQRKVTGKGSKLGVFIEALGNNTDKWLHKWIKFIRWAPRDRAIEVVAAPIPKLTKATTAKGVLKAAKSQVAQK